MTYQFSKLKRLVRETGGRWDLFQKTAKSSLIPWNGSEASKLITGQPQKGISVATLVFPASTEPPISGLGACRVQCRVWVAVF
jgi:hypothetical protein